jgi:site-specific recombinase XerD
MKAALKLFEYHIRTKNLSPKTISVYGERLGYFYKYLQKNKIPFDSVSKADIQDYILYQKNRGLADISINGQIKVLKIFFKFLLEEDYLEGNPTKRIELLKTEKRLKPIISEEDIEKILYVPDRKTYTGMRNFCMILVFYDTLIRLNELVNIKMQDIDLDRGTILIYGKGRKERVVPIGAKTTKFLYKFLINHRKIILSDYLFCTMQGRPLDHRNVLRILQRIGRKVNVHVSPHLIRHSGASHRAISGMPAFLLQKLLGHTTIQMTEKYIHLVDNEKLRIASKQYSPLDTFRV